MDTYIEQLVSKRPSTQDTLKKLGIAALAVIAAIVLFFLAGTYVGAGFGFVFAAGALYGGYYLLKNTDIEYEYIVTNGEIDVDKIIARSKRKRLITVKASSFTGYGLLSTAPNTSGEITTIQASSGANEGDYYADFKHKDHGSVRLIFSPNDRVIESIRPYVPHNLK